MNATANLSWTAATGATGYKVEYKKSADSSWTLFVANQSGTTANIPGLLWSTPYDFRVTTICPGGPAGGTIFSATTQASPYAWVADTFACEQDSIFTVQFTVTGLSSPNLLMYDPTTALVYGVDVDSTVGHFFHFDPATIAQASDVTYVTSYRSDYCYVSGIDPTYRRLYAAGKESGGLKVYDIASGTISTVAYGQDHNVNAPQGNGFNRLGLTVLPAKLYAVSSPSYGNSVAIIDRAGVSLDNEIPITTIPQGSNYISNSTPFINVGSEVWVMMNGGVGLSNIACYNSTLTSLNSTINISAYSATWDHGGWWRGSFYDSANNVLYVYDCGANTLIVINTLTKAVVYTTVILNRRGKSNSSFNFVQDPITSDLFMTGYLLNSTADGAAINRTYIINRSNYTFSQVFFEVTFSNLTRVGGTNTLWGAATGQVAWNNNDGYSIDGTLTKYMR